MGYVPPPPWTKVGESDFIEVTILDDPYPRYAIGPKLIGGNYPKDSVDPADKARHYARMDAMHAETMRHARIGTALVFALALAVIGCIADWTGLI